MFIILLVLAHVATGRTVTVSDGETGLDCTNDYDETMFCEFVAQNCSEYNVTVRINNGSKVKHCSPTQCGSGRCCCSFTLIVVFGEIHKAEVWRRSQVIQVKDIAITESVKPKTPTITSVDEVNGNFLVKWKPNMSGNFLNSLTTNVTYYKEEDTKKITEPVKSATIDGLDIYEIRGQDLEPSTTYVVSVKTFTSWSNRSSDTSEEMKFTTPVSSKVWLLAVIISLCVGAVLISSALFACVVGVKRKWWDTVVKVSNPKLLKMRPNEQLFLNPESLITSPICVEPLIPDDSKSWSKGSQTDISSDNFQQSSGISTGSSSLSYAHTEGPEVVAGVHNALRKALPNIGLISPLTITPLKESNKDSGISSAPYSPCDIRGDGFNPESTDFDNKSYSLISSYLQQNVIDIAKVQTQTKMLCDFAYHSNDGEVDTCPDQQVPACPLLNLPPTVSSPMPMEMSYQQCNANPSLGCATDPNIKTEVVLCDQKPRGIMPGGSHSFPPVDDAYQAFENVVGQPATESEQHLDKYSVESLAKICLGISGLIQNVQAGHCLPELQRPSPCLITAEQPMSLIIDSGYQSV